MPAILIVDDESVDRELATRCLESLRNMDIRYAEDGAQALAAIESARPDLVLTDLRMPGIDGLELVERIGGDFPSVPVVLMTSQGNELIAVRALKAGAASYVPKRNLKEELATTVTAVLEVAESERSRSALLQYLDRSEIDFELVNDLTLIPPLVRFFQDSLEQLGFGFPTLRMQIGMAVLEAVTNAMIHGNLEVSSELRRDHKDEYYRLIERRRSQQPYADRRVRCSAKQSTEQVEYIVRDQGHGFDPTSLPDPAAPENILKVSGRGILLIRTFMDRVEFRDNGSEIRMTKINSDGS